MWSLQKMQNFFFCFFCQPFSSFSFRFLGALAIQRRLPLWGTDRGGNRAGPVALAGPTSLPFDLRGGPLQAGPDLLGLDLDLGALVALRRLPRVGAEPADHHDAVALRQ